MSRLFRLYGGFVSILALTMLIGMRSVTQTTTPQGDPAPSGTPHYFPIILKNYPDTSGPTRTPTPTLSPFNFTLQPGSPAYVSNFANNQGCNWFGMSGQVFNLIGAGVPGLLVHVDGPNGLTLDSPTGGQPKYGVSGWEVSLGIAPVATTDAYFVQLRNGSGQPLSDTHMIPTYAECNKNHIIINFVQNH
jgi:hypothetical protein